MKDKLCQHAAKRRGRPRKGETIEGTKPVPCYHYNAAMQLQTLLEGERTLRSILPHLSHEAGQRTLALHPDFTEAFGEYLASRWGQKPANRVLVPACADQEHPIRTIRPEELWLLHGVIGDKPGFDKFCMLVFHAQHERNQSTRTVKNDNFTEDYLAVLALIAATRPDRLFATEPLRTEYVRRWTGEKYILLKPKDFGLSLNQYHASLIERLRGGMLTGLRESVLKIVSEQLMP